MKSISALVFLLMVCFGGAPTLAAEPSPVAPTLSGLATNALVRAYQASGLDTSMAAPLRLRSYVVTIYASQDSFLIMFTDTAAMGVHNILVSARSGAILWRAGDPGSESYRQPPSTEALMLPGLVAGEIIAVYREAQKLGYKPFQTGAYYTSFTPWPDGTFIAFWQTQRPTTVSINPAPNCDPDCATTAGCSVPGYTVRVLADRVQIQPDVNP